MALEKNSYLEMLQEDVDDYKADVEYSTKLFRDADKDLRRAKQHLNEAEIRLGLYKKEHKIK